MLSCILLFGILAGSLAQHVHYEPPEVLHYVQDVLSNYSRYTQGPAPSSTGSPTPRPTRPVHQDTVSSCSYWLEDINHQGYAAFNDAPSSYQVFRNVMDFGAKGDGVTDDTAAIQSAISSGGRCAPGSCQSTTVTPAVVYFPAGTYMISSSIIDYYYTQIIGNPNCLPTIKALPNFAAGLGLIDADPYQNTGNLGYGSTNVFWRQIRNFIIDTTLIPATSAATGIHWPTAQATSLQNIVFNLPTSAGTQHVGLFIENGSGGFMNDLVFNGGSIGMNAGNQQFSMRNLTFNNCATAINQLWDWSWSYKSVSINTCGIGLNMAAGGSSAQTVASITFYDSSITDTPIGIITARDSTSQPSSGGSLIVENVQLVNVPIAIQGPNSNTLLAGTTGSATISGWGQGHEYPNGPTTFQGPITPNSRPSSLLSGSDYYERSKPQYEQYALSSFVSARTLGAAGNGVTDDTSALQGAINTAAGQNQILFLDHGDYKVTSTINIPAGAKIVGESYSVILSSGSFFADMQNPQPVIRIGYAGDSGIVELSDLIISTQGAQPGATLIEYNLASPDGSPSGLWDVHTRVGGFAGSDLQLAQCPTTPSVETPPAAINTNCIAAFMDLHITASASGLYMENNWLWVADHDVEDPSLTQITIYAGRGLLDESAGPVWLVGTGVEHHQLYEYQFSSAQNVFAAQIQTETAYYQPNPDATSPFPAVASLNDPTFVSNSDGTTPSANGWGLRIVDSENILIYGAGHYTFFNNYNVACSNQGNGEACQSRTVSIEGTVSKINIYNLNTVGTTNMITRDGEDIALYSDNLNGFVDTIALYRD